MRVHTQASEVAIQCHRSRSLHEGRSKKGRGRPTPEHCFILEKTAGARGSLGSADREDRVRRRWQRDRQRDVKHPTALLPDRVRRPTATAGAQLLEGRCDRGTVLNACVIERDGDVGRRHRFAAWVENRDHRVGALRTRREGTAGTPGGWLASEGKWEGEG